MKSISLKDFIVIREMMKDVEIGSRETGAIEFADECKKTIKCIEDSNDLSVILNILHSFASDVDYSTPHEALKDCEVLAIKDILQFGKDKENQ